MKPAFYQKKWDDLKGRVNKKELSQLSRQIALSFLDRYFYNDYHEEEYIRLICEMATSFDDDELNKFGSLALFGIIIEGLCDDFEELQTKAYNKVMSQVLDFCRTLPAGKDLKERLAAFGLNSYHDILSRIEEIRAQDYKYLPVDPHPEKIILLSRVTIGADVAITSVLIQRLGHMFPSAEILIIGGSKVKTIFGGNPRIRVREVNYSRHGNLLERFTSWFSIQDVINEETKGDAHGVIVVDPDSRLTQLGVLPIIGNEKYMFFNSRGNDAYPKKMSIAELTNYWIDKVMGKGEFYYPKIWLPQSKIDKANCVVDTLRKAGCKKIIVLNFGVGGNSRKRMGDEFEEKLLLNLLQDPNTVIILDQGFGKEELSRSEALIRSMQKHGFVTELSEFESLKSIRMSKGIIGVVAEISDLSALIAQSDEFIGYDSACQHIAASLGIPTYTVFAGSNNPRFIRRWSACGPSKSEIIHVDTLTYPPMFDTDDVVMRIVDARAE
ncbi:MAG: glycosyltransferase family 9 protein [Deltaproteobacteria bacterium]|nr:glycosyltransferase family 9 protein [Deltaproteobacteria bacterium]